MREMYGFHPRRCTSNSSLSGCIERNKSVGIIALPTNGDTAELFEKTLFYLFIYVFIYLFIYLFFA